jgi:hypothetical protein
VVEVEFSDKMGTQGLGPVSTPSNYLISVVAKSCEGLWRQGVFTEHYESQQYVVYLLWQQQHCKIGELLLAALAGGYVRSGTGFR